MSQFKKLFINLFIVILFFGSSVLAGGTWITENLTDLKSITSFEKEQTNQERDIDWWPMFHHDPTHSGYSSMETIDSNETFWEEDIGGRIWSTPAFFDNRIYFGSYDWNVYCLDADTGEKLWNYTTNYRVTRSSPCIANEKVYIGSMDGNLYCLDAYTGEKIWDFPTGDCIFASPAVSHGRVFFGSFDTFFYCLDAETGDELWKYQAAGKIWRGPTVRYGHVYFGSHGSGGCDSGVVYCVNITTGIPFWSTSSWYFVRDQSPPAVDYNRVFITNGGSTYSLDAFSGEMLWRSGGVGNNGKPCLFDGKVYVGSSYSSYSEFTCLDAYGNGDMTTDVIWTYPIKTANCAPVISDEKVIVNQGRSLYCLDAYDGSFIWNTSTLENRGWPAPWQYSNPIVAENTIYIGIGEALYSFNFSTGEMLWSYIPSGCFGRSSPAVDDWRVYIGTKEHWLYCTDVYYGGDKWAFKTQGPIESSPTVSGSRLFFGSNDHKLYCLWASNYGGEIWNFSTNGPVKSSPTVVDNSVYVGSDDGNLYCIDVYSKALNWKYETQGAVRSSPAVDNGKVFVGSNDGKVYCLDTSDGSMDWNYSTGGSVESSPAVVNNRIYVGSNDGFVYCLDAANGDFIWSYPTGGPVISSPAVAGNQVAVGSDDGILYCLDASDGSLSWSFPTGGSIESSPAMTDNRVFVGSCDSIFYAINAATGDEIWRYQTGAPILSSPAISYGDIFVGSNDRKLRFFGNMPPSFLEFDGPRPCIGKPGEELQFSIGALDWNNDQLYYHIDWGDGTDTGWIGPYPAGQVVDVSHAWEKTGSYTITAIVKDEHNQTGYWPDSESLDCLIASISIDLKNGITAARILLKNDGDYPVELLIWEIDFEGGRFLRPIKGNKLGAITPFESGQRESIRIPVFGFGLTNITASAYLDLHWRKPSAQVSAKGVLLGPIILLL